MASESPVAFRPALSRNDAVKPPSPCPVGVVMLCAHLPNAGRMDFPLPDPGPKTDRKESPSPGPWARPARMVSPRPPVRNASLSPPDRVEISTPVSGARLDPASDSPSPPVRNASPSPPDRVETPNTVSRARLDPASPDRMDSPSPPESLKVPPSPPDGVEIPIPVSGARLDP
jgi:hypothetical protein